ncbi:MAG: PocR ligand-binding domain-containing protein [Candidatus Cloacimonetes bacterium]|nr:PocR ligand-binding domain-containing protein [Candidatus Cloacimonadota bacterium]
MENNLIDLIDFKKVNVLLEGFNKLTGFVTAILDLEGKVLSKSGWRQICTGFHRINPETSKNCRISDTVLAGKLAKGEKYHFYKCLNGLVDVAVPIIINGEQIANLFSGQFFFEEPDKDFFIKQAQKYGFNVQAYLDALSKVPVVSKDKVITSMDFLLNLTQLISEMTFHKKEQMELNKSLRESEERLRLSTELANVAVWEFDFNKNEMSRSKNHDILYGLEWQKKWEFETFLNATHPDDREFSNETIQRSAATGGPELYTFDFRVVYPDKSIHWLNVVGQIVARDQTGQGTIARGCLIDITDRKLAEKAREKSERTFSVIFNKAPFAAWLSHLSDGSFLEVNEKFEKMFGFSRKEIIGKTSLDLGMHPDPKDRENSVALFKKQGFVHNLDMSLNTLTGEKREFLLNSDLVEIGGEKFILTTANEITERKRVENELKLHREHLEELVKQRTQELEIAKTRAESADRLKSAFLATMSHELRTPLNSIIGFSSILLQETPGPLNPEQKKQLGMVKKSSHNLLSLINDVLDLSKIEAGQLNVNFEKFKLCEIINKVVENCRPFAEKKNLELKISVLENVETINSDKRRVEQIFLNLVNNAIKFTLQGSVKIECKRVNKNIIVKIIDTGIGIEKEKIDLLFKPFSQIDTGLTRAYEGTGLGLSICRKLLDLLSGDISVESELGKGSIFTVTLPVEQSS